MEYYHNDAGLTKGEFEDYNNFLVSTAVSGNNNSISAAMNTNKNYFSDTNLMQDYLYLKMSWPEPFKWVYLTPSLQVIYNIEDKSALIGLPISYKPITNVEFIFWPTFLLGNKKTEFGSKQYKNKLDLWIRFYF